MANMDEVMDKLHKLQALADQPGTPEEAAAAMAAIQRLMTRHNITEITERVTKAAYGFTRVPLGVKRGSSYIWRLSLLSRLGEINQVVVIDVTYADMDPMVLLSGTAERVSYVAEFGFDLINRIDAMSTAHWHEARKVLPRHSSAVKWKRSFSSGAVITILRRLQQDHDSMGSSALAILSSELANVTEATEHHLGAKLRTVSRTTSGDVSAWVEGRMAGESMSLREEIANG